MIPLVRADVQDRLQTANSVRSMAIEVVIFIIAFGSRSVQERILAEEEGQAGKGRRENGIEREPQIVNL